MARCFLLLLFFMPAACSSQQVIPVPSGGPEALPAEVLIRAGRGVALTDPEGKALLKEVAAFYDQARSLESRLWPGWNPEGMAMAVRTAPDQWWLIQHGDAPPGMQVVDQKILSYPVHTGPFPMSEGLENEFPFRGRLLARIHYDTHKKDFIPHLFNRSAAYLLHQLDHIALAADRSPLADGFFPGGHAETRALARMEAALLHQALTAVYDEECLQAVAAFLEVRSHRHTLPDAEAPVLEQSFESAEGYLFYVEIMARHAAAGAAESTPAASSLESESAERLLPLQEEAWEGDAAALRTLGMIQALLLDRLYPGWKTEFLTNSSPILARMLGQCVPAPSPEEPVSILEEILLDHDFTALAAQEEAEADLEASARIALAKEEVLSRPVFVEVILDPSAPMQSDEFGPYDLHVLAPGITRPSYMHLKGWEGTEILLQDCRVLRDRVQGVLLTSCLPQQIRLEVEGKMISMEKYEEIHIDVPFLLEVPGLRAKINNGCITGVGGGLVVCISL